MTNRELQQQLQTAFVNASPKSLPDDVVAACVPCEDAEEPRRKPVVLWRPMVAAAAVLALIVTGVFWGIKPTSPSSSVTMTVSLDVNPSITLEVDDAERIVAVNTLNEDGSIVVGDREWTGAVLETAVGSLVDTMVQNGYLNDKANSILISVDGTDEAHMLALEQKLSTAAQAHITGFEGAVISQTLITDDALAQKAVQYGISRGKAKLIDRIVELDPRKRFDDLVTLSINDLNLLCRTLQMPGVNVHGNASDKAYIGSVAATDVVLAHMGITVAQASDLEVELDCENGVMCYEVEFVYNGTEYEYEIDATSAAVLRVEKETIDKDEDEEDNATTSQPTSMTSPTLVQSYLSEQQIKAIVLTHAGVGESTIVGFEMELEWENGLSVYEMEFRCGDIVYEYRVDAVTGEVLFSKKETERPKHTQSVTAHSTTTIKQTETTVTTTTVTSTVTTATVTQSNPLRLSKEQVKAIVLTHAGVCETDIRGYECELDKRNDRMIYEIEFSCGGTEYEYRVDALTGDVLFVGSETDRD